MNPFRLRLSDFDSKKAFFLSFAISVTAFVLYAIAMSVSADFVAINGLFQNYNAIRRFLDGQIPYQDFAVYLGPGHLWLTGPLTWILGGTFGDSIYACNIIAMMVMPLMIYGLSRCFYRWNGLIPLILCMLLIVLNDYSTITYFTKALCRLFGVGNSARGIRGMILPVAVILGGLWLYWIRRRWAQARFRHELSVAGLAGVSGFALCWSNDYGPCVWLALNFMILATTIIRTRSFPVILRTLGIQILASALFVLITGSLVSEGHFGEWVHNNFAIAGYQKWYYFLPREKITYYYLLDFGVWPLLVFGLFVYYFVQLIRHKADDRAIVRYGIPAFCCLTSFGADQAYHLFSGGGKTLREVMHLVFYACVGLEIAGLLIKLYDKSPKRCQWIYSTLSIFVVSAAAVSICYMAAVFHYKNMDGKYIEKLGGNFTELYSDVDTTASFLKDHPGKLFSMYSSAAEVFTDQFQPSGTDYVIHVLSDDSRSHYLESLAQPDIRYVTSIVEEFPYSGTWIRNANWFVYRKIYSEYHIVFQNSYQYFWERNANGAENRLDVDGEVTVDIEEVDANTARITVHAPGVKHGIADLHIDYSTEILPGFRSILIVNSFIGLFLNVKKIADYTIDNVWCLRPVSSEYIPVEIIQGKGTLVINSYPEDSTAFHLHSAKFERILPVPKSKMRVNMPK